MATNASNDGLFILAGALGVPLCADSVKVLDLLSGTAALHDVGAIRESPLRKMPQGRGRYGFRRGWWFVVVEPKQSPLIIESSNS